MIILIELFQSLSDEEEELEEFSFLFFLSLSDADDEDFFLLALSLLADINVFIFFIFLMSSLSRASRSFFDSVLSSLSSSLDLDLEGSVFIFEESLSLSVDESFLTRDELTTLVSPLGLGGGEQAGLAILWELLRAEMIDCGLYTGVLLPSLGSSLDGFLFKGSGEELFDELPSLLFFP